MPELVQLILKIDGKDVKGDSAKVDGTIDIDSFSTGVACPRDAKGVATSRVYSDITYSKPVDKTSPLVVKALTENQPVEAVFSFYRQASGGAKIQGTEEFYKITLKDMRVTSITQGGSAGGQPQESVSLGFGEQGSVTWTWVKGGVEHTDNVYKIGKK